MIKNFLKSSLKNKALTISGILVGAALAYLFSAFFISPQVAKATHASGDYYNGCYDIYEYVSDTMIKEYSVTGLQENVTLCNDSVFSPLTSAQYLYRGDGSTNKGYDKVKKDSEQNSYKFMGLGDDVDVEKDPQSGELMWVVNGDKNYRVYGRATKEQTLIDTDLMLFITIPIADSAGKRTDKAKLWLDDNSRPGDAPPNSTTHDITIFPYKINSPYKKYEYGPPFPTSTICDDYYISAQESTQSTTFPNQKYILKVTSASTYQYELEKGGSSYIQTYGPINAGVFHDGANRSFSINITGSPPPGHLITPLSCPGTVKDPLPDDVKILLAGEDDGGCVAPIGTDLYFIAYCTLYNVELSIIKTEAEMTTYFLGVAAEIIKIDETPFTDTSGTNPIQNTWKELRDFANVFLIIGLIIIAFANLLRVDLENYHIKLLLPRLIIFAILINLSFLIAFEIIRLSNVITGSFTDSVNLSSSFVFKAPSEEMTPENIGGYVTLAGIGAVLWLFAFLSSVFLFAYLILRVGVVWILTITSSLPYLFSIIPFTRSLSGKWWSYFTSWVFMGPAIMLVLYIGASFNDYAGSAGIDSALSAGNDESFVQFFAGSFWQYSMGVIAIIIACLVPSMLGDKIAGIVGGAQKWASSLPGKATKLGAKAAWGSETSQGARAWRQEKFGLGEGSKMKGTEKRQKLLEDRGNRMAMQLDGSEMKKRADNGDMAAQYWCATKGIDFKGSANAPSFIKEKLNEADPYAAGANPLDVQRKLATGRIDVASMTDTALAQAASYGHLTDDHIQQLALRSPNKLSAVASNYSATTGGNLSVASKATLVRHALQSGNPETATNLNTAMGADFKTSFAQLSARDIADTKGENLRAVGADNSWVSPTAAAQFQADPSTRGSLTDDVKNILGIL